MDKCFYCNKKIEFPLPVEVGKDKKIVNCCNDDCAKKVLAFYHFFEQKKILFYIGITLVMILLFVGPIVIFKMKLLGNILLGLSLFLMGLTFLLFPFATPQTFQMLGIKKTIWLVRIIGICIIVLSPLIVVF